MTPAQFTLWKTQLGLSIPAAATALGISESSVSRYLAGSYMGARRDEAVTIPKHIELACAAIAARQVIAGLMEIAELAMPDTYFQTDSRVNAARKFLDDDIIWDDFE